LGTAVNTGAPQTSGSLAVLPLIHEGGTRARVVAALTRDGFRCHAAAAAEKHLSPAGRDPVDAVVFAALPGEREPLTMLSELHDLDKGARLVVVAPSGQADLVRRLISSGLDGAVFEPELEETLASTLRAVCAGQLVVPRKLGAELEKPTLSSREKQILGMIVLGLSNSEIAARLVLAESTVKSHLHSAYRKLGVRSRHEAAARILDPAGSLGTGILSISEGSASFGPSPRRWPSSTAG